MASSSDPTSFLLCTDVPHQAIYIPTNVILRRTGSLDHRLCRQHRIQWDPAQHQEKGESQSQRKEKQRWDNNNNNNNNSNNNNNNNGDAKPNGSRTTKEHCDCLRATVLLAKRLMTQSTFTPICHTFCTILDIIYVVVHGTRGDHSRE